MSLVISNITPVNMKPYTALNPIFCPPMVKESRMFIALKVRRIRPVLKLRKYEKKSAYPVIPPLINLNCQLRKLMANTFKNNPVVAIRKGVNSFLIRGENFIIYIP